MKINSFDKSTCQAVRLEIDAALKPIAEKFGISLRTGNGTFSGSNFTLKLIADCISNEGIVESKEAKEFKLFASHWGLKPEDMNAPILIKGVKFQITGATTRSYKFPILVKNLETGKTWKYPVNAIKSALGYPLTN